MQDSTKLSTKEEIRAEYESTRVAFHALLDSLSERDLEKKSLNRGWTNAEILFHMTFGFMVVSSLIPMVLFWGRLPKGFSKVFAWILNHSTGFFNWINALGARGGGRAYRGKRVGQKFENTYSSLLKKLNSIKDTDWQRGMYYPVMWESLFNEYMTLEDVFRYPVKHFNFHLNQIAR